MATAVITYGTFDLFHIGHLKLLQRLSKLGDKLIVAVSTDEFNAIKGKKTIIPFAQRAEIVENIKCVDMVIAENNWEGKFYFLKDYCNVVYLKRTENISSTQLKQTLKTFSVSKNEILKAFDILEQLKKDFE